MEYKNKTGIIPVINKESKTVDKSKNKTGVKNENK